MWKISNRVERSEIRPGDHIYTYRAFNTYCHHGIYVGENKVIHYTNMRKEYLGFISEKARGELSCAHCEPDKPRRAHSVVGLICLDCFLQHGSLYRYQYGVTGSFLVANRAGTCTTARSNPSERVVHCANYMLLNGFGYYNVFRNNCEDFALYCKTELFIIDWRRVGRSGQVLSAFNVPRHVLNGVSSVLMAAAMIVNPIGAAVYIGIKRENPFNRIKRTNRYGMDIGARKDVIPVVVEELPLNLGRGEILDEVNTKKMRDLEEKIRALKKQVKWYGDLKLIVSFFSSFTTSI